MTESRNVRIAKAAAAVNEQVDWMEHCGGTRSGYRARYGRKPVGCEGGCSIHSFYGEGGDAIFEADLAELRKRQAVFNDLYNR